MPEDTTNGGDSESTDAGTDTNPASLDDTFTQLTSAAVRSETETLENATASISSDVASLRDEVSQLRSDLENRPASNPRQDMLDVTEEGADDTGEAPIDDVLEAVVGENTQLYFPPGRYLLDSLDTNLKGLELHGQNATLVPTHKRDVAADWFASRGDQTVLDGFEFDFRETPLPPEVRFEGADWRVKNVAVRGSMGLPEAPDKDASATYGRGYGFVFAPSGGDCLVQDFYAPDGAADPDGAGNRFGMVYNGGHVTGNLTYDRVWLENWPNNTIYHHTIPGKLTVKNAFLRNTDGCLRCGGDTLLQNVVFVKDGAVPPQRWWNIQERGVRDPAKMTAKMRGVWTSGCDQEFGRAGDVVIEGCEMLLAAEDHPGHVGRGIRATPSPERLVVRDTRIDIESDDAEGMLVGGGATVDLEDVHVRQRGQAHAIRVKDGVTIGALSNVRAAAPSSPVDDERIRSVLAGTPAEPDVLPPLPKPPAVGETP